MPFDPGLGSATKSCTGPFQDTTVLADPLSDEDLRDLRGLRVGPNSDGLQPIEAMASNLLVTASTLLEGCAEPNTRSERFSRSCGSTSLRLPGGDVVRRTNYGRDLWDMWGGAHGMCNPAPVDALKMCSSLLFFPSRTHQSTSSLFLISDTHTLGLSYYL